MKRVLILGGLGNASVIADAILDANLGGYKEYECVGYINDKDNVRQIEDRPVLGGLKDVQKFLDEGYYFINTIYKIDGQRERIDLFNSLNIPDDRLVTFTHPTAYVAPNVQLSPGCIIMPNVCITSSTKFGKCCIVRPGATVGHNNVIGAHTCIISGARVGSFITIGEGVHISLGAIVQEFVTIGNYSTVGIGSVAVRDIGESEIWFGNPAKFLRYAK